MTLNKEAALLWAEALETGIYPQGTGYLNDHGAMCCIGVGCEVMYGLGLIERDTSDSEVRYGKDREDQMMPVEMSNWLGIEHSGNIHLPVDYENGKSGSYEEVATELNDGYEMSFREIAKSIRHKFELPEQPELPPEEDE